jgi:hypothetical protein
LYYDILDVIGIWHIEYSVEAFWLGERHGHPHWRCSDGSDLGNQPVASIMLGNAGTRDLSCMYIIHLAQPFATYPCFPHIRPTSPRATVLILFAAALLPLLSLSPSQFRSRLAHVKIDCTYAQCMRRGARLDCGQSIDVIGWFVTSRGCLQGVCIMQTYIDVLTLAAEPMP